MRILDFKIRGKMNGIKYPCLVDIKYDGITCLLHCNAGSPMMLETDNYKYIMNSWKSPAHIEDTSGTFLAEWIAEEGLNGNLGKILHVKSLNDRDMLSTVKVFDCLMFNEEDVSTLSLVKRKLLFTKGRTEQRRAESIIANNKQEVMAFYEQVIKAGYEGVVVKNLHETLKEQTWVKIKKEEIIVLPVTKREGNRFEVTDQLNGISTGLAYNKSVSSVYLGDRIQIKYNGRTKTQNLRNPVALRKV